MFAQRNVAEVAPLIEWSFTPSFTPGAVGNNATVGSSQVCTVGNPTAPSAFPATFAVGDTLLVFPPAAALTNGLVVTAAPGIAAGTATLYFQNATGGAVTPVAGVYKILAVRQAPNIL